MSLSSVLQAMATGAVTAFTPPNPAAVPALPDLRHAHRVATTKPGITDVGLFAFRPATTIASHDSGGLS